MISLHRARRPAPTESGLLVLAGIGIGALLMYLFDPALGRQRRAFLANRTAHGSRVLQDATEAAVEAAANRTRAAVARVAGKEEPADDSVLAERVRAAVGKVIADVQAIDVRVREGIVTLKGPATAAEIAELV